MAGENPTAPAGMLQPRLKHIQIHPVDALGLKAHTTGQHLGDGALPAITSPESRLA
jgi:hypothetical protein